MMLHFFFNYMSNNYYNKLILLNNFPIAIINIKSLDIS